MLSISLHLPALVYMHMCMTASPVVKVSSMTPIMLVPVSTIFLLFSLLFPSCLLGSPPHCSQIPTDNQGHPRATSLLTTSSKEPLFLLSELSLVFPSKKLVGT